MFIIKSTNTSKSLGNAVIVALLFATAAISGCDSSSDSGKSDAAKSGIAMAPLDLSSAGFKVVVDAPKGATAKEEFGRITVKHGDGFQLSIGTDAANIESAKKEIAANDINKLKGYVIKTKDALLYESAVMGSEFHFLANVKVGNKMYQCEDVKGPTFTKQQVQDMLNSCKSLKVK